MEAHHAPLLKDALLVRQPVYNQSLDVIAQELLYHYGQQAAFTDTDTAGIQNIVEAFGQDDMHGMADSQLTLLKISQQQLNAINLPERDRLGIEVVIQSMVDDEELDRLKQLSQQGVSIVLSLSNLSDKFKPLLVLADIIKLNLKQLDKETLRLYSQELKQYQAKLMVEGVDNYDDYELCSELAFDYYKGFFLSKPRLRRDRKIDSNRLVVLRLISKLQDEDVSTAEIVTLLSQDVRLSYKLLRIVNSASFTLPRKIESLHEAIVILGLRQVRGWASLIALSNMDHKPHELMLTTMVRAKMAEILMTNLGVTHADLYFTVGAFSTLDAMLDMPMSEVLEELPLSQELKQALLKQEGDLGRVLNSVLSYETAQWDSVDFQDISCDAYREAYLESVHWASAAAMTLYDSA